MNKLYNNQQPESKQPHNPRMVHIVTLRDGNGLYILGASIDKGVIEKLYKSHQGRKAMGEILEMHSVEDFKV